MGVGKRKKSQERIDLDGRYFILVTYYGSYLVMSSYDEFGSSSSDVGPTVVVSLHDEKGERFRNHIGDSDGLVCDWEVRKRLLRMPSMRDFLAKFGVCDPTPEPGEWEDRISDAISQAKAKWRELKQEDGMNEKEAERLIQRLAE